MYLSIGSDMAVRDTSIIGIFHMDNTDDLPKSFILTAEYGFQKVYLTSLSSYTLEKRRRVAADDFPR